MKLECVKDKLRDCIIIAEKITGKNLNLPVLSCILLETFDKYLKIKSTNLEMGVEFSIPANITKHGSVAVSGFVLNNILNNIYNEKNIIIESKNENLSIITEKNSMVVKSFKTDDFPTIPNIKNGDSFKINSKQLIKGIKSVVYSSSISDIKPEISSIYIYPEGKDIIFVSTDSIRLAEKKIHTKNDNNFNGIILPSKSANEIIRVFDGYDGDLDITCNNNQISIFNNETHFTSRVVNGTFPDYGQIIPKKHTTEATILKEDILNGLKITNIFSDKFNRVDVSIDPKQKIFDLKSQNTDVGENTTKINAVLEGEPIDISFNQKYITDCFQSIPQDSTTFYFTGKNKPLLIKGVGETDFLYLVMPINN